MATAQGDHLGVVRVGTSGWRYPRWRHDFYPAGLRQRDELTYLAQRTTSVEVNGTFYSLQRPSSFESWAVSTPEDFVFAVKGSRFITHMRGLSDVRTPLANFLASGLLGLGARLGPVLWQLPGRMTFDAVRLGAFLDLLPRTTVEAAALAALHDDRLSPDRALTTVTADRPIRYALEPRHDSFARRDALALLRKHDVALVVSDSAGTWPSFDAVTAGHVYVRLHGESALYAGGYRPQTLDRWADRMRSWSADGLDVYVYFDNDAQGHAPHDAVALLDRRLGLPATRHPGDGG